MCAPIRLLLRFEFDVWYLSFFPLGSLPKPALRLMRCMSLFSIRHSKLER